MLQQEILKQSVEYNGLITDVFSRVEFSSLRNNYNYFWVSRGATMLKEAVDKLVILKSLTEEEIKFLKELQSILSLSNKKDTIKKIGGNKVKELFILSLGAIQGRDIIIKENILENNDFKQFKEVLFLLEANVRLIDLIKDKLRKSNVDKRDITNIQQISKSLIKTYYFLMDGLTKDLLIESMADIREIWRHYHPLSELLIV